MGPLQRNQSTLAAGSAKRKLQRYRTLYIMLIPAILFLIIFAYFPMYGILIAFKDYYVNRGILRSPWVGFEYFQKIFQDPVFWRVFRNTVIISLQRFITGFPAPIILALLLNFIRMERFKKTVQTIIYLPHFISWVVISSIIFTLLSENGVVNSLLLMFQGTKVDFLTNPAYFRPILIISGIWKEVGWGTIIYLASLSAIPAEQYEAAVIDGAGRLKQTLYITLPSMVPVIVMMLILNAGTLVSSNFDQVFNLYNPMVYEVGDVIDTYVYRIGITKGNYSVATAIGLFINVINLVILVTVNKVSKKATGTGLY